MELPRSNQANNDTDTEGNFARRAEPRRGGHCVRGLASGRAAPRSALSLSLSL